MLFSMAILDKKWVYVFSIDSSYVHLKANFICSLVVKAIFPHPENFS